MCIVKSFIKIQKKEKNKKNQLNILKHTSRYCQTIVYPIAFFSEVISYLDMILLYIYKRAR